MRRRTFTGVIGSIAAGTVGYATLTRDANALQVSVDQLDIPNKDIETSVKLNSLIVSLGGSYGWNTVETPTRALLRVTVGYNGTTQQVAAQEIDDEFAPSHTGSYAFPRVDVTEHPDLDIAAMTPGTVGDTNSYELTFSVTLEAYGSDGKLGETTIQDTSTLGIERTEVQLHGQLNGTAEWQASTETLE